MTICSECRADIDIDEFDVDPGDRLSCLECGADLVVSEVSPVMIELAGEESAGDFDEQADEKGENDSD